MNFFKILFFMMPILFGAYDAFGQVKFSEKNLASLEAELESLKYEVENNGLSDDLKSAFSRINEYDFRSWLRSGQEAELRTRAVISHYNDIYLEVTLDEGIRDGVIKNAATRLLSATDPKTLSRNDLERLTNKGQSKDLTLYEVTKSLGLYEGYVEGMVTKAFEKSPQTQMGLAVSLGLEAAAPFMSEAVSKPFDPESLIPESSTITTLDDTGKVIQKERVVYAFVKDGSALSIRRAANWLLNSKSSHPEIALALSDRLNEIESFLPEGEMPQFRGLIYSAISQAGISSEPEPEIVTVGPLYRTPEPASEKSIKVTEAKTSEEPVEQSSNWWLWLIGAVVVVGGILVLRAKK